MKFSLIEKRHILNEKFILTEADKDADKIRKQREERVIELYTKLGTKLYTEAEIKELNNKLNEIARTLKNKNIQKNITQTISDANDIVKGLETLVKGSLNGQVRDDNFKRRLESTLFSGKNNPVYKYLNYAAGEDSAAGNKNLKEIKDNYTSLADKIKNWKPESKLFTLDNNSTEIKMTVQTLLNSIKDLLEKEVLKSSKEKGTNEEKISSILQKANNSIKTIYGIEKEHELLALDNKNTFPKRITTSTNTYYRDLLDLYEALPEKLNINDSNIYTGNFIQTFIMPINRTAEILLNFNNTLTSEKELDNEKEKEKALKTKKDWDTLIKNASAEDAKAYWDEYYETEWGDQADKIRDLGEPFENEVLKLGFSETTNPFITFLKNNIKNFEEGELDAHNYGVLHNAYIDREVTANELTGQEKVIGKANLIFCPDWYANFPADMLRYLDIQIAIKEKYDQNTLSFKNPIIADKYGRKVVDGSVYFAQDLFYEPGNTISSSPKRETRTMGNIGVDGVSGELKTLERIREEWKVCFGENMLDTEQKTVFNASDLRLTDRKDYIDAINYLKMKFIDGDEAKRLEYLKLIGTNESRFKSQALLPARSEVMAKLFNKYTVTEKNVMSIIKDIYERGVKEKKI